MYLPIFFMGRKEYLHGRFYCDSSSWHDCWGSGLIHTKREEKGRYMYRVSECRNLRKVRWMYLQYGTKIVYL